MQKAIDNHYMQARLSTVQHDNTSSSFVQVVHTCTCEDMTLFLIDGAGMYEN